jgi:AAA15 family ATPase/GTPase
VVVTFSISNFRSFLTEETLSLVASGRLSGSHENHTLPIPDSNERVLRTAVLYGANGAGKSNVLKALTYLQAMALRVPERSAGTGREAFRFADVRTKPSVLDLQFIANGKLYRYGIKVDAEHVREEWLIQVRGSRENVIFERALNENGDVVVEFGSVGRPSEKLTSLAGAGGRGNHTFLAFAFASLEKSRDLGEEIKDVLEWFEDSHLTIIGPTQRLTKLPLLLAGNPELLAFNNAFLRAVSTGVDCLTVEKSALTEQEVSRLATRIGRASEEHQVDLETGTIYEYKVGAVHCHQPGQAEVLDLSEESDGTRRLLDLTPALFRLQNTPAVFCIDEIDRSLHPQLVRKYVEFFLESCPGNRQLIMTTHESNLLDQDLLRRDEIWFVEKDQAGASRMYSLLDFKVRKDLEIRKGYLQGRFGAVPFLGDVDRLMEAAARE